MPEFLIFEHVTAGYGHAVVLNDVSFSLNTSQSLAILGRNGVGKTTLLETLMGNTRQTKGKIWLKGQDITKTPSYDRAKLGLGWVPQEREVFPSLTVEENLTVTHRKGAWSLARVYKLFPRLEERRKNYGNQLSGGEQQMLTIGRALMLNPEILLLDEPMEGLAPIIVEKLSQSIRQMCELDNLPSVIIEQHPILTLSITDQSIILEHGRIVHASASAALANNTVLLDQLLGVSMAQTTESL